MGILKSVNQVVNKTATEILDDQVINKVANVVTTFLNSGVEAIKNITQEQVEAGEEVETSGNDETDEDNK